MMDNGFRVYTPYQIQRLNAQLAELAEYRATGLTPAQVAELARAHDDPAPEPLDLYGDLHLGAGLLADDDFSPALVAQGAHENEQWNK